MPKPLRRGLTPDLIALVITVVGLMLCVGSAQWLLSTHTPHVSIGRLLNSFSPSSENAFFTEMLLLIAALTLGVHGVAAPRASDGFVVTQRVLTALAAFVGGLSGWEGFRGATLSARGAGFTIAETAPWHAGWLLLIAGGLVAASVALASIPLIQARRAT